MVKHIVRGFPMVYSNSSCGPDGIAPIINQFIKEEEVIRRLAEKAIDSNRFFCSRATLIPKPGNSGHRPI